MKTKQNKLTFIIELRTSHIVNALYDTGYLQTSLKQCMMLNQQIVCNVALS